MKVAELFAELGLKISASQFKNGEKAIDSLAKKSKKRIGSLTKKLVGLAAAYVGIGTAINGIKSAFKLDESLKRLEIASGGAIGSTEAFKDRVLEASNATGIAASELLEGASAFVAFTGDGKTAKESLGAFAKIAQASGSSVSDITSAAGALNQNLGITGGQMEKAFSILIKGGKAGAVELNEMASLMAPVTAQFQKFSGSQGTKGLAQIGAAFQLVRRGAGSSAQAATQLEAMMRSLGKNASKFKKSGVDVFNVGKDGKKTLKSLPEIVKQISNSKLVKDPEALAKAFGRDEGAQALLQIIKNKGEWGKLVKEMEGANDVQEDFKKISESSSVRVSKAWQTIKNLSLIHI